MASVEFPAQICPVCLREFRPRCSSEGRVYCSVECYLKGRLLPRVRRSCPVCGKNYTVYGSKTKTYCGVKCANWARQMRDDPSWTAPKKHTPVGMLIQAVCLNCGGEFQYCVGCRPRRFCSQYCYRHYERVHMDAETTHRLSLASNARYRKREALKRGALAEAVSYSEIYERDAWICGICKQPVDRCRDWPDPLSASIDHIVPLSRGGAHTAGNLQCAHLRCNSSKSNRGYGLVNLDAEASLETAR